MGGEERRALLDANGAFRLATRHCPRLQRTPFVPAGRHCCGEGDSTLPSGDHSSGTASGTTKPPVRKRRLRNSGDHDVDALVSTRCRAEVECDDTA